MRYSRSGKVMLGPFSWATYWNTLSGRLFLKVRYSAYWMGSTHVT